MAAPVDHRYIVIARPFYRVDVGTFYLDEEGGLRTPPPAVGDVVTVADRTVDADGDVSVAFNGARFDIAAEVLVSVGELVRVYRAASATGEGADGPTAARARGTVPVLSVDAVATELAARGIDGPDADVAIAMALLRTSGAL